LRGQGGYGHCIHYYCGKHAAEIWLAGRAQYEQQMLRDGYYSVPLLYSCSICGGKFADWDFVAPCEGFF
jgi:hypothetical protein